MFIADHKNVRKLKWNNSFLMRLLNACTLLSPFIIFNFFFFSIFNMKLHLFWNAWLKAFEKMGEIGVEWTWFWYKSLKLSKFLILNFLKFTKNLLKVHFPQIPPQISKLHVSKPENSFVFHMIFDLVGSKFYYPSINIYKLTSLYERRLTSTWRQWS